MRENDNKYSITLCFAGRRLKENGEIVDTNIFEIYQTLIIKDENLLKIYKQIKKDFLEIIEKYE